MSSVRDASTTILLRESAGGFEVFLVRRHGNSAFMGGAYVFPGGKLDEKDCDDALTPFLPEGATQRCTERLEPTPGQTLTPSVARGLYVAAARELFEEAGVLVARHRSGDFVDFAGAQAERFEGYRAQAHQGELDFPAMLATEDLLLDLDTLTYWAHWVTPSLEPRRFDARFFLVRLPPGQTPLIDERETTDSVWHTPAEALAAYARGEVFLTPPTLRNLEDMAQHDSLDALFEYAFARKVGAILPRVGPVGENMGIILPWDPLYAEAQGEALPMDGAHPMASGPSRIVLEGERWVSRNG